MKSIKDIKNLKGRTALVRVDFNVPLGKDGIVDQTEDWRIEKSLETIRYLSKMESKVILISHIGKNGAGSLRPVADHLQKSIPVQFVPMLHGEEVPEIIENMEEGSVILLENLRSHPGEEGNTEEFAAYLASLADFYVNEAFSVSHRRHASIVGVTKFLPSYAGLWFEKEIESLKKAENPEKPLLFIIGGAKFGTKIPLIEKFSNIADQVFIGGALANNFLKNIGFETGTSLLDPEADVRPYFQKENIKIPFDVLVKTGQVKAPNGLSKSDMIVDMGPETLADVKASIATAKTILWNGPLGLYEEGFDFSSKEILKAIASSSAYSIIGGGDTVKLISEMGLQDKISFVSTAGGAMLDFLSKGTLPGIEALEANNI